MIENLIKRIEKEYKYGSKFKLSLAEMFFYVKWFGMIVYSNFLGKSFFGSDRSSRNANVRS